MYKNHASAGEAREKLKAAVIECKMVLLILHVGLQVGASLGRGGFSGSGRVHLPGSFHLTIYI